MEKKDLIELIPPTISLICTSIFAVIVGILVEKFKNRLRIITYQIYTNSIKPNLSQNMIGHLKITLSDREIQSLKISTIELENTNNIDLENVTVRFNLSNGGIFQSNEAYLVNANSWLFWTETSNDNFQDVLEVFNELPPLENGLKDIPAELQNRINIVNSNREYLVPVFNRKEKAIFNFLYEDPLVGPPSILSVTLLHKSVALIRKQDETKKSLRDLWIAVSIGVLVVATIISLISYKNSDQATLVIISTLIGMSYSIVGYLILWGVRKVISYLV